MGITLELASGFLTRHKLLNKSHFSSEKKRTAIKMNIYLAGFLLATLCISGCFGACPVGNPATYSIDGTNSCTCSADGRHACTRMMPMTWPDGSVRCRKDYYADPCNLCQCVNGRGVCTLMVCASKFWD